MDKPPQGVVIGSSMPFVRDWMVPEILAATADMNPVVSLSAGRIRWENGREAFLCDTANPDRLRGLSIGWAYMDQRAILGPDGRWYLDMALREEPGKIVGRVEDIAALIA